MENDFIRPEIRFQSDELNWEEYKIGEIFKVTRGQVLATSKTSQVKSDKNPYPVYSSQTKNNGLMGYYNKYLFDTAITWTTDGANAGTVNFREGKFYSTNVNGVLLSEKGYANKAVAEALNLIAWKYVSKVGNPKLMNNVMSEITIALPKTIKQQEEIGDFFEKIDNIINLHQQELNTLKQTKQGFLQKMFPKEGESVPKLRFPRFTDDWEKSKIGKITDSFSGGTPSANKKEYYGGSIPFIRSGEINSESTELFLSEEGLKNSSAKLVKKGDVLYAMYGATSGEVGISKINGAINQAILALKPKGENDANFITQWLIRQKTSIVNTFLQGGQGNLSGTIVKEIFIPIPTSKEEQIQIGNFFKQLDELIALQQQELDALKQTKKAFLQKMLV